LQSPLSFVRNVQGMLNFVAGDWPVLLREDEFARILDEPAAAATAAAPMQHIQFKKESKKTITDSPFAESFGEGGELDLENEKTRVSLSLFGRETPVELQFRQAERVNN
jgi:transcriptional antiterminator NusG